MSDYNGEIDFEQIEPPVEQVQLSPCPTCNRTFNPKALAKHAPICQRTTANAARRGTFESSKQRVGEGEGKKAPTPARKKNPPSHSNKPVGSTKKKADWREKHKQFIQNIRAARKVQKFINEGGDVSSLPPPPPSENPDYVKCPICSRRFNEDAAERHVKFCEEKSKRERIKKNAAKDPEAMERMKRRTAYKPPSLRRPGSTSTTPTRHQSAAVQRTPRAAPAARPETVRADGRAPRPPPGSHPTKPSGRGTRRAGRPPSASSSHNNSTASSTPTSRPRSNVSFQDADAGMTLLDSRAYPFNRERPPPDDELLEGAARHRNNRHGSASSMGSNRAHRIGSAARPKYCGHCGEALQGSQHKKLFCTECGTRFMEQAKFCSMCGTRR
ncbi:hypothetical protein PTSG_04071 [Salpingoeca rosetta]|uniref:C2HC/C3H-type domain-containing protein n=1 Tax=Salpingoeca rosetta (strain ATCC 50818 / BSB-021) TaxID=946362 RepID=F2U7P6_SALR5|nr:uncharacterized protein PTSG_04071 [Salpingoeca rosetta]EGD83463.1 hypothetical protein PTSG_04071 [Salpingoeca rosetta]|eukprot:XP_004994967.1 hypothetical protein PTSG_04071 [Salpingoeca rosetta]